VQRAAEQRGAARSVCEDTGCGAALAAVEPIESGRKKEQRRRSAPSLWGVELEVRVSAPDRGAQPPRAAFIRRRSPSSAGAPPLIAAGTRRPCWALPGRQVVREVF
jgi:hypothetical protein